MRRTGDEVCLMHKLTTHAVGLHDRGPANDVWLAMAALMHVGFVASQRAARKMPACFEILRTRISRCRS